MQNYYNNIILENQLFSTLLMKILTIFTFFKFSIIFKSFLFFQPQFALRLFEIQHPLCETP